MFFNKKKSLTISIIALICGLQTLPTLSAPPKKKNSKKKSSGPSSSCLACLAAFDDQELKFTITPEKCTKIVANCDKKNRTSQCENIILDCIDYNCTTKGSCSDEMANRSLFYGCLKATNQFLPYQCASYIAGFASSKASEVQSILNSEKAEQNKAIEAEKAKAEKAKSEASIKAAAAQKEAEAKVALINQETTLKQQQLEYELKQKEITEQLTREAKLKEQQRNSQPNVKYNNIINAVKKDISTAKTYSNKAYNLLGITKTENTQTNGNLFYFPPQIISMQGLNYSNDPKTKALTNGSKYKQDQNFVCTKDTKESYIKTELNNIYNILKKSKNNLINETNEIENLNIDSSTNVISETKITNLYHIQNKLSELLNTLDSNINTLTTSCETRCKGISTTEQTQSSISGPLEFDENGNIIDKTSKEKDNNKYTCKDFETTTSSNSNLSLFAPTETSSIGGIGEQVANLTQRVTRSVLEIDRLLEETEIAIQSGKFGAETIEYPAIDSCIQYMVLDIASYTNCVSNVLGQQLLAYSKNTNNEDIKNELTQSIKTTVTNLQSPNYTQINDQKLYCPNKETIKDINPASITITDINNAQTCILSITNALNQAKETKKTTGKFNFNITGISGTNLILSSGEVIDPTTFAKTKLDWNDITDTSCTVYEKKHIEISPFSGPYETNTDLNTSYLNCTCTDNTIKTITLQGLNLGNAGRSCSEKQGK